MTTETKPSAFRQAMDDLLDAGKRVTAHFKTLSSGRPTPEQLVAINLGLLDIGRLETWPGPNDLAKQAAERETVAIMQMLENVLALVKIQPKDLFDDVHRLHLRGFQDPSWPVLLRSDFRTLRSAIMPPNRTTDFVATAAQLSDLIDQNHPARPWLPTELFDDIEHSQKLLVLGTPNQPGIYTLAECHHFTNLLQVSWAGWRIEHARREATEKEIRDRQDPDLRLAKIESQLAALAAAATLATPGKAAG